MINFIIKNSSFAEVAKNPGSWESLQNSAEAAWDGVGSPKIANLIAFFNLKWF